MSQRVRSSRNSMLWPSWRDISIPCQDWMVSVRVRRVLQSNVMYCYSDTYRMILVRMCAYECMSVCINTHAHTHARTHTHSHIHTHGACRQGQTSTSATTGETIGQKHHLWQLGWTQVRWQGHQGPWVKQSQSSCGWAKGGSYTTFSCKPYRPLYLSDVPTITLLDRQRE